MDDPQMISVNKASLLAVVRKLDFGANPTDKDFPSCFDDLRSAFTPEEISTGRLGALPAPTPIRDAVGYNLDEGPMGGYEIPDGFSELAADTYMSPLPPGTLKKGG